jgi:hypothetical protein
MSQSPIRQAWTPMNYKNTETKLDTLVTYFNSERINLNPVFQRGRVWLLKNRRELMKNILRGRPIPAIFLYKDETGSAYTFNVLDGKQRLESILMFIGSARADLAINTWSNYIFDKDDRKEVGFAVALEDGKKAQKIEQLDEKTIRNFREYPIPTIEIELNENTSLDEMISLFVDINQYGVKVTRLQIVAALKRNDKLLRDTYLLVAERQARQQDKFARRRNTSFAYVLKRLQVVGGITDPNEQADRMWEKMFELTLFVRSGGQHRKPTEILKSFIKSPTTQQGKLTKGERGRLTYVFDFLMRAYKETDLEITPLATDQTHFYTMVTALLDTDLMVRFEESDLIATLTEFGQILENGTWIKSKKFLDSLKNYREVSAKQTTDVSRRESREKRFKALIILLAEIRPQGSPQQNAKI